MESTSRTDIENPTRKYEKKHTTTCLRKWPDRVVKAGNRKFLFAFRFFSIAITQWLFSRRKKSTSGLFDSKAYWILTKCDSIHYENMMKAMEKRLLPLLWSGNDCQTQQKILDWLCYFYPEEVVGGTFEVPWEYTNWIKDELNWMLWRTKKWDMEDMKKNVLFHF